MIYDSKTGNVERFVNRLNINKIKMHSNLIIDKPFFLITYTTGMGQVPESTNKFLNVNYENLKGVASSGNKNWGRNYAIAADIISAKYGVPIICKFELSGTEKETYLFLQEAQKFVNS